MNDITNDLNWLPQPFEIIKDEESKILLIHAYDYGNTISPDPSTKNGAILIDGDYNILTHGANRFPRGIAETDERLADKPTKYGLVVHAESNAVLYGAKKGIRTEGSIMYCPFYCCSECAKDIIQGGIVRVIGHAQLMAKAISHKVWVDSIIQGWSMLTEAGVQCCLYDGNLGVQTRFNGQDILV